jgi:hypothetical protein
MTTYDDYKLAPSPIDEDVPCACEGDPDDHFGDHCNHCRSCTGYRPAQPCGCGALVSRDCRCDGGDY